MRLDTNTLAIEISHTLATTGDNYTADIANLGAYGTSCEITKRGSDRKLHLTPVDGELLDMVLYDETGTTIASGTLFNKTATNITPEDLANLVELCF